MKKPSEIVERLGAAFSLIWNYAHKRKSHPNFSHEQNDICWHIIGKMETSYSNLLQFCANRGVSHHLPNRIPKDPSISPMKEEDVIKLVRKTESSIDALKTSFPGSEELKRCDLMMSLTAADLIDLIQCALAKL